jgi:hypothetical protein
VIFIRCREPVGGKALYARIEVELVALVLFGIINEPLEELFAIALRSVMGIDDEIFEVEVFAPGEVGGDVEPGDGDGVPIGPESGELVAPAFLLPNLGHEAGGLQVGAQLQQHGQAFEDFGVGLGAGDHGERGADRDWSRFILGLV